MFRFPAFLSADTGVVLIKKGIFFFRRKNLKRVDKICIIDYNDWWLFL